LTPREYLASELRRARHAAGFSSHEALASRMAVDRTLITKAESGNQRVPSDDVLVAWAEHTGGSADRWRAMAEVARSAADGPVPRWFESWLDAEQNATVLRYWDPIIITPVFQTAEYARALLMAAQTDTSGVVIDALVEAKLARQRIFDRADPPEVVAVIDEHVLHRLIGSHETVYEQLLHVADLAGRPYVCVQVVPADVGATAGLAGEICLASGDGADVLHTDAAPEGHTTDSRPLVRQATVAFERVRGRALPRDMSQARIMEVANEQWKQ
jgi:transcriptional regulator with XRE-family HTH domain